MGELRQHQAAFRMHGRREAPVSGDDAVVDVDQGQPAGPDLRPADRRRPGDLHAEPGFGASTVIFDIAVSRQPVIRETRLVSGQIDARTQPLAAKPDLLVDLGVSAACERPHRQFPRSNSWDARIGSKREGAQIARQSASVSAGRGFSSPRRKEERCPGFYS